MSDEVCFFACSKAEPLITAGPTRIGTVIDSSKKMNDLYHIKVEQRYSNKPSLTIQCHKSCVSSYTSHHHTKRYNKRKGEQEYASSEPPWTKIVKGYEDIDRNMFFKLKEGNRTRGHKAALVKEQCRLDMRKYSFSQRVINEWNKLPNDCVNASSVNMFKDRIDRYLIRAGYT